jgi:hypothetical protein
MAFRITLTLHGQPLTLEGDTPEEAAALARAMFAMPLPGPSEPYELMRGKRREKVSGVIFQGDAPKPAERSPRGYNGKLVLQALAAAGQAGLLQAHAQQWIKSNKNEDLAISSVRHALNQLQGNGFAMRTGDVWRISGNGVRELAKMENFDLLGMEFQEPPEEPEDEDIPF